MRRIDMRFGIRMGLGTREKRVQMFRPARMHRLSCFLIVLNVLGRCPASFGSVAPIPQTEARVAEAVPVEHPPKLDGTLNDSLWLNAKPITDFRQRDPHEGEPPTERTEVRILYTRHAVISGSIATTRSPPESSQPNCDAMSVKTSTIILRFSSIRITIVGMLTSSK